MTRRMLCFALLAAHAAVTAVTTEFVPYFGAESPDYNNQIISDMLHALPSTRPQRQDAYAVFDWDNTCMFGDLSETAVLFQLEALNYRIPPRRFFEVFAVGYSETSHDECLPQGLRTVLGQSATGVNLTIVDVMHELVKDYTKLFDMYIGPKYHLVDAVGQPQQQQQQQQQHKKKTPTPTATPGTLDQVKNTTVFQNFRANMGFFLSQWEQVIPQALERSECAMNISMTLFPQLLVGMTSQEIRQLLRESTRFNLAAALAYPSFQSEAPLNVTGYFSTGLRVFNGQESLMRALRANGVDVFVITAAPELFVQEVAQLLGLTYLVPDANVFGVRFHMDQNDHFTGVLVDQRNYPITWGPGKARIIQEFLMPAHNGKAPVLVSGDSTGDCDMLELVRDGVVHVNNRLKAAPQCIQSFYDRACALFGTKDNDTNSHFLLQGQDAAIGSWISAGFSTKDGAKYSSGASASAGECKGYSL